jgi:hypothetical protein
MAYAFETHGGKKAIEIIQIALEIQWLNPELRTSSQSKPVAKSRRIRQAFWSWLR